MTSSTLKAVDGSVRRLLSSVEAVLIASAVFYLLYEFLLSHVEGDQAFLLYAAQQVLAGVQLDGPRLIETNPPLIVWFSEIPAAFARLLHVEPVMALRFVVSAMLACSAVWGARILRLSRVPNTLGVYTTQLLWALTFFLILITQPAEFGQREQLLLVLFLPYLLASGTDVIKELSTAERIALGIAAGLGICFKPHHVLTIACLEVFLAVYKGSLRRLWSPELLAAASTGLLYVCAVRVFTPTYIPVIVPLLGNTYWALGQYTFAAMALHAGVLRSVSVLVGAAIWWALRRRLAFPQASGALLASATGATLAFFVQHTGWYHQAFPAIALFQIAVVWLLLDAFRAFRWKPAGKRVWVAGALCGVLAFMFVFAKKRHSKPDENTITSKLAAYPPGTTVYAFTVSMSHFPVVLEHGLVWGSRFAHLWMVPAIRENETSVHPAGRPFHALSPERVGKLAALQRTETTDDLNRTKPSVIFVERCDARHLCDSYTAHFDAIRWFSQSSEFAKLWSHYQYKKPVQDFDEYVRRD